MPAILLEPTDHGTTLRRGQVPRPGPVGPGEVRIAVRAVSVNRADVLARTGSYVTNVVRTGPAVAGMDAAGEVLEVGDAVRTVAVGDRVMALAAGSLAAEVVCPAATTLPIPSGWSYVEGAAAVVGLVTEHDALVRAGRLARGEVVLVHAAASGVGTQAVQLARHLGARLVLGTSRSDRHAGVLEGIGLDALVVPGEGGFVEQVVALAGEEGVDVVVDHVGGPYLPDNVRVAALGGRLVDVGRLGGATGTLDLEEFARKRLELLGCTFRTRTPEQRAAAVAAVRDGADLEAAADVLRPVVHATYVWDDALAAQEALLRNEHVGKLVLETR
ncbi:zinc-binding dehydrogenase [Nocardioides campestrisoli]|uniref:zinc-binding dehydrogenase n=1 Tax=Nocardioides campestrisoli TaxID=2736757 RepID=UPI001CD65771|nr:zinc-binding dehydrogenase [Nocardioides campestrisoli]